MKTSVRQCGPVKLRIALALSLFWVAGVAIPQHPWLVVWGHTLQDWLGSELVLSLAARFL